MILSFQWFKCFKSPILKEVKDSNNTCSLPKCKIWSCSLWLKLWVICQCYYKMKWVSVIEYFLKFSPGPQYISYQRVGLVVCGSSFKLLPSRFTEEKGLQTTDSMSSQGESKHSFPHAEIILACKISIYYSIVGRPHPPCSFGSCNVANLTVGFLPFQIKSEIALLIILMSFVLKIHK